MNFKKLEEKCKDHQDIILYMKMTITLKDGVERLSYRKPQIWIISNDLSLIENIKKTILENVSNDDVLFVALSPKIETPYKKEV